MDDKWSWADGSRFKFTGWAAGQPNNENHKHIAFNFKTAGGWNDEDMNSEKGFLCQYTGMNIFLKLVCADCESITSRINCHIINYNNHDNNYDYHHDYHDDYS